MLGPAAVSAFRNYQLDIEGTLRFISVGVKLRELRNLQGLELKETAAHLRVPQYRLREIESSSIKNINGELVSKYAAFLGAGRWLKRWSSMNLPLAERLGLIQSKVGGGAKSALTSPSKRTRRKRDAVHG